MDSDPSSDSESVSVSGWAATGKVSEQLVGRDRQTEDADALLTDPNGPRLVLVRGERGAGRTAFVKAVADRQRARDVTVIPLVCTDGDERYSLLLALRLFTAVQEHLPVRMRQFASSGRPVPDPDVLSAVEQGDSAALADSLLAALERSGTPTALVVDDVHYADAASLSVLGRIAAARPVPDVRLVLTATRHTVGAGRFTDRTVVPDGVEAFSPWAADDLSSTIDLPRLTKPEVAAMVVERIGALPDAGFRRRVNQLTRGVPGAVDALLSGWLVREAVRVVDGHAFVGVRAPVPVLPAGDRFMSALYALGPACRTVAGALSLLWPLGRAAATIAAEPTGLSGVEIEGCLHELIAAGLVDEIPGQGGGPVRGWRFQLPLFEHAVRERLGPLERARLSAAAVRALWTTDDQRAVGAVPTRTVAVVDEVEMETYLPDRIADAGVLVDRERAAAELAAAAQRFIPDREDRDLQRWQRAVLRLVEEPAARETQLVEYAKACFVAGDYKATLEAAEALLCGNPKSLTDQELQVGAFLLVIATTLFGNWPQVYQMGTAEWWERLRLPAAVTEPARAMALLEAERWKETVDLLAHTEPVWGTEPGNRLLPDVAWVIAELVLGRPERFVRSLTAPETQGWPPGPAFALTTAQVGLMLGTRNLSGAVDLLAARSLPPEALPPTVRFLLLHLRGNWDDSLALGRWTLASGQAFSRAPNSHALRAWMAQSLLARGYIARAGELVAAVSKQPEGPLTVFLDAAEAELLCTVGRVDEAEQVLRRGLAAVDARGHVYATDELLAALCEIHLDTGKPEEARVCVERLKGLVGRTSGDRTRLLYLLSSARLLRPDSPDEAHEKLRQAIEVARSRSQPFETAVTLAAAASGGVRGKSLLHEAYELFGQTGALLHRFRTRAALRDAGLSVPGRKQATIENEQLLAILVAEGLSNREISTVLRISEDAVANRLTRLFARTGLRSRTEVVSAVLSCSARSCAAER